MDIRGRGVHSSGTSLQHFALLTLFSHALFGHREVRIQLFFSYLNYMSWNVNWELIKVYLNTGVFFLCRFYMLVTKHPSKALTSFCNGGIVGIFLLSGKCQLY